MLVILISLPSNFINLSENSSIQADVLKNAIGNGGNLLLETDNLYLAGNSFISASTLGEGKAGELIIQAGNSIDLSENSSIQAGVLKNAIGDGGNLLLETARLTLTDGAQISVSTFGKGNAGELIITATDSIELNGNNTVRSGLFVSALEEDGNSGELKVFTQDLIIRDGAIINVGNFPSIEGLAEPGTGEAGNLTIEADNIILENGGRINAATQVGDDGNITLKVAENITLRDNSSISAQAFKDGTGGDLDIDAKFIIAFPSQVNGNGNDIIASAEQGQGGEINITAQALFGIQEQKATADNRSNDIDASSEFGLSGTVNIRQPDVNPASGLIDLTQELVNASELIAQNVCTQTINSEFINVGKGGLPLNPEDILTEENVVVGLVEPVGGGDMEAGEASGAEGDKGDTGDRGAREVTRKLPAQGWVWLEDGMVELVAYDPNQQGEPRIWDNPGGCQLK